MGDLFPHLVTEWDSWCERSPFDTTTRSDYRASWVCEHGHRWRARVADRTAGTGCRVCAGKEVLKGFNDLESNFPLIAKEWSSSNAMSPSQVTKTSGKMCAWVCSKGHPWKATVASRTSGGNKCPYCSGRRAIRGETDLTTTHPEVARDWHPDNTESVTSVKRGSSVDEYLWRCIRGHTQRKTVRDRVEFGCTTCSRKGRTSRGERDLASFLVSLGIGDVETSVRHLPSLREVDMAIHARKIALEFNGVYWHSTAIRKDPLFHYNKYTAARRDGYVLLQVWEDDWRDRRDVVRADIRSVLGVGGRLPRNHHVSIDPDEAMGAITSGRTVLASSTVVCSRRRILISNVHTGIDYTSVIESLVKECRRVFPDAIRVCVEDDLCLSREHLLRKMGATPLAKIPPRETSLVAASRVPLVIGNGRHSVFDAGARIYRLV